MGPPQRLPLAPTSVLRLCQGYGAGTEAMERVLRIEAEVFPLLQERWALEAENKGPA